MPSPLTPTAVEPDEQIPPGTHIGPYVVDGLIGAGVFGAVYAAHHPVIDKPVAIKVLHRRYSSDPEMIARFVDEARAASHIDHPGIVAVFDFGRLDDGRRYTVMERLTGQGLDALLAARGRLDPDAALAILDPLARALAAAHAAGVAHRDVKPGNVFVCADGPPKLLDFGVAKLLGMPSDAERTATGVAVGTPAYMAPEQCLGVGVGPPVDVYALGVLAFRMLAGRLPFDVDSSVLMMAAHLNDPPPRLDRVDRRFGRPAARALARMMDKDPARRPDPVDGVEALRRALGQGRGAPRFALPIAAALLIAAGLGLALWTADPPPPAPPTTAPRPIDAALPAAAPDATPPDPAPPLDAAPATVDIELAGLPDGAAVTIDDQPTPLDGATLRLPRSAEPITLRIEAPGHLPHTLEVVPAAAHRIDAALRPRPQPRRDPPRKPDPHGIDDW